MLDRQLLPLVKALLAPLARYLLARGVAPDQVTIVGFGLGVLAVPLLALGWTLPALALIVANRVADGLDGTMARLGQPTDRGAFLDIALDFFFYALVPLGFALCDPARNALPAAVLIAAFAGTGASFLGFAVLAERRGLKAEDYPAKGFYYLGGLTEGSETIAIFVLMCLLPGAFPWLAYGYAAACLLTSATRWRQGWIAFGPPGSPEI